MSVSTIIIAFLLGLAVLITVVGALGVLVMRDGFQRLHFTTPPAVFAGPLIAIAVWIADNQAQARIKGTLIAIAVLTANTFINHTNGRAFRLRAKGHFDPLPSEQIAVVGRDEFAGERPNPMVEP